MAMGNNSPVIPEFNRMPGDVNLAGRRPFGMSGTFGPSGPGYRERSFLLGAEGAQGPFASRTCSAGGSISRAETRQL